MAYWIIVQSFAHRITFIIYQNDFVICSCLINDNVRLGVICVCMCTEHPNGLQVLLEISNIRFYSFSFHLVLLRNAQHGIQARFSF